MNREELTERLNELVEDRQFAEALGAAESVEDMVRVLGEYGVNVTAEELEGLVASVPATGELSEEDLEAVAGGGLCVYYWMFILGYILGFAISKIVKWLNSMTEQQQRRMRRQYGV